MRKLQLLLAFAHFTWIHSGKFLLVTDLQGIAGPDVGKANDILLTDPAIHCPSMPRFGGTNLMQEGVDAFFESHECNKYCKALRLG